MDVELAEALPVGTVGALGGSGGSTIAFTAAKKKDSGGGGVGIGKGGSGGGGGGGGGACDPYLTFSTLPAEFTLNRKVCVYVYVCV